MNRSYDGRDWRIEGREEECWAPARVEMETRRRPEQCLLIVVELT